jgi:hypothetical protein
MKNRHYMIALALSSTLVWGGGTVTGSEAPLDSRVRSWSIWRVAERIGKNDADIQRSCASYISAYGMSSFIRRRVPALVETCLDGIQPPPPEENCMLPSHMRQLARWRTTALAGRRWEPQRSDYELALEEWAAVAFLCEAQDMKDAADLTAAHIAFLVSAEARSDFRPVTLGLAAVPRVAQAHGTLVPQKLLRTIGNTPLGERVRNPVPNALVCGRILAADVVSTAHARVAHLIALVDAVAAVRGQLSSGMDYRPKTDLVALREVLSNRTKILELAAATILEGGRIGVNPPLTHSPLAAEDNSAKAPASVAPSQVAESLLRCIHVAETAKQVGAGPLAVILGEPSPSQRSATRYNTTFRTVAAAEFAESLGAMEFADSATAFAATEKQVCVVLENTIRKVLVYTKGNAPDITNNKEVLASLAGLDTAIGQLRGSAQARFRDLKLLGPRGLSSPAWARAVAEARLELGTEGARLQIWMDQARMRSMVGREAVESSKPGRR